MKFVEVQGDTVRFTGTPEEKADLTALLRYASEKVDTSTYGGVNPDEIAQVQIGEQDQHFELSEDDLLIVVRAMSALSGNGISQEVRNSLTGTFDQIRGDIRSIADSVWPLKPEYRTDFDF